MSAPALTLIDGHWLPVRDGDDRARALYLRHYSVEKGRLGTNPTFVGVGEKMVLLTPACNALFVWRHPTLTAEQRRTAVPNSRKANAVGRYVRQDEQDGTVCSIFRNESDQRSSDLIREACDLAWVRWPGQRLYTYVNPGKIRSTNPGFCFIKAGWRRCGMSKGGLVILECLPEGEAA